MEDLYLSLFGKAVFERVQILDAKFRGKSCRYYEKPNDIEAHHVAAKDDPFDSSI